MSVSHISTGAKSGAIVKSTAAGLVCLGTAFAATGHASAEEVIVGLVTKTKVNPFFEKMRQAAEEAAKAKAADQIFDRSDLAFVVAVELASAGDQLDTAGAKGILVTPNNSTGMLGVIKKARAARVLVIALDTATNPADAVDATFATDNFQAGVQQGD
ncbi:MAG: periplasmic binding domain protein [Tardiphaga sp.]|nr:periplasmic binding domain protein [Tardiphaga sp.]